MSIACARLLLQGVERRAFSAQSWRTNVPNPTREALRPGRKLLGSVLVALLAVMLISGTAFAGKGSGGGKSGGGKPGGSAGGSSTVALVMVSDSNSDGLPNWGDTITFNVTSTVTGSPYLDVSCYQGTTLVFAANAGFYASYPWPGARNMPLYSPSWTGGAADCTAVLNSNLFTLRFHVNP